MTTAILTQKLQNELYTLAWEFGFSADLYTSGQYGNCAVYFMDFERCAYVGFDCDSIMVYDNGMILVA